MPKIAFLLCLVLVGCSPSQSPLEGAWISDRETTLAEFKRSGDFSEEQWSFLSEPTLFGQMIQVFSGEHAFVVFDGECGALAEIRALRRAQSKIEVELEMIDGTSEATFFVENNRLQVPLKAFGKKLRETFRPISITTAAERHPCVSERLQEISTDGA